jgi:hypothetical protein
LAVHLREGDRWRRLRICQQCKRRLFFASHLRSKTCPLCIRSRGRAR